MSATTEDLIAEAKSEPAPLLPLLHRLHERDGHLSEEALRAVTINPAEIFGVDDRIGSIRPGRDANLIVTDGDPLQPLTRIRHLLIGGRPVPLTSRQTRLYEKWR